MGDKSVRSFTASEVRERVDLFHDNPEFLAEKIPSMEFLAGALSHFEEMTDTDIEAEVRAYYCLK